MDYKEIVLSNGKIVKVSPCDYDNLIQYKWTYSGYYPYMSAMRRTSLHGDKVYIKMHRQIMGVIEDSSVVVDHINGDKLDNRRENLRLCTQQENIRNQKLQVGRSSKYKGVYYSKNANAWRVQIKDNGHIRTINGIEDEKIAGLIYDLLALDRFKEFARFNNVDIINQLIELLKDGAP